MIRDYLLKCSSFPNLYYDPKIFSSGIGHFTGNFTLNLSTDETFPDTGDKTNVARPLDFDNHGEAHWSETIRRSDDEDLFRIDLVQGQTLAFRIDTATAGQNQIRLSITE